MNETWHPLNPNEDFWFRSPVDPSAVDRLAAIGNPSGEAARRCREWDERLAEDKVVVERLTRAPSRYSFRVDVSTLSPEDALAALDYFKRKLRGDPDVRAQFRTAAA